mmetsp:Transcript_58807/g.111011  ORF Transcript_58807/g.111011 Transcript_58807/m.111011 type:complete len:101 (+) Transcript_58807:1266-1568(+)
MSCQLVCVVSSITRANGNSTGEKVIRFRNRKPIEHLQFLMPSPSQSRIKMMHQFLNVPSNISCLGAAGVSPNSPQMRSSTQGLLRYKINSSKSNNFCRHP